MTVAARKPTPKKPAAAAKAERKPGGGNRSQVGTQVGRVCAPFHHGPIASSKRCQIVTQAGHVVIVDQFELATVLTPTEARALAQAVLEAAAAAEQRPKRAAKRRG